MTDILKESPSPESDLAAEHDAQLRRAMMTPRVAAAAMPQLIEQYAPAPPVYMDRPTEPRVFTHLPADRDAVIEMADRFDIVAQYAEDYPNYLKKTGMSRDFERLHQEIEATARQINPLRSIHIVT